MRQSPPKFMDGDRARPPKSRGLNWRVAFPSGSPKFSPAGSMQAKGSKQRESARHMRHLSNPLPILFIVSSAATLVFIFAFLLYSTFVSDSEFAEKKTSIVMFRLAISSALAALAFGIASLLLMPLPF